MTLRLTLAAGICLALHATSAPAAPATPAPEGVAFFEQKIRPVLVSTCYECHSAEAKAKGKLKGGLFLDTRAALLTGGDEGPALVAGKPDESLLIKALRWSREDLHMPPKKKLPPEVIADFERWIAMGAPDPRTGEVAKARREISIPQGRDYWAFRPLKPVTVPAVKNTAWAKTPVDRFILAKLEKAKITPSKTVGREQLLRRATFDLTGLPPTPEEIVAWDADSSTTALSSVVNKLLAKATYGERWGRHWLDVVRYAESNGYEFDAFRPGAFHYRDWVIRALNDGMPYDRFIRWQLAGDRLQPDSVEGASAAGFLVAGPYPGQITAKTIERIRYDQLDDMVSTIGSGFLGLTLGCVRCHEHKYDPIPQTDYYGIAAALARTVHGELKIDRQHEETQRKLAAHKLAGEPLLAALKQFEAAQFPARFSKFLETEPAKQTNAAPWQMCDVTSAEALAASLEVGTNGVVRYLGNKAKDDTYTVKATTYQRGLRALRLDALADAALPAKGPGLSDNGNFVLSDFKVTARPLDAKSKEKPVTLKLKAVAASFEQVRFPLAAVTDNRANSGWAIAPQFGKDHAAVFSIEGEPVGFEGGTELEFQIKFTGFFGIGRMRLGFSNDKAPGTLAQAKEEQNLRELHTVLATTGGALNETNRAALFRWYAKFDTEAQRLKAVVREHAGKTPKPDLVPVYSTKAGGQDVHLLRRGEVDSKISKADPNYLQVLNTAAAGAKRWLPKPEADPRIALGDWLTDAQHGAGSLLARVMVNRVWQHHFGRGLVATPNDFGVQGKPPTHPELLDWLAGEFVRGGWQLKPLHQLIMASAVYQQGAELKPANLKADPENKLWWHRPARRLEAEAIRDALLTVGGRMEDKLYGPSETNYESPRRSVYLRVKRSELIPFLTLFDAPEPAASVGERGATTLPTQALAMMNSTFVRDIADRLTKRVLQPGTEPAAAIAQASRIALGRAPTPAEQARLVKFYEQQLEMLGPPSADAKATAAQTTRALTETCLVLLCMNEFIYVD
ncbi:MAG: PSD1 and planctomycete cytochrome C domain-containing protein [Limisphaerales bacterium]